MIDSLACSGFKQIIIFSFRKWILRLAMEKHLPEEKEKERMCTSAPTLNIFPEPPSLSGGWLPLAAVGLHEAGLGFL